MSVWRTTDDASQNWHVPHQLDTAPKLLLTSRLTSCEYFHWHNGQSNTSSVRINLNRISKSILCIFYLCIFSIYPLFCVYLGCCTLKIVGLHMVYLKKWTKNLKNNGFSVDLNENHAAVEKSTEQNVPALQLLQVDLQCERNAYPKTVAKKTKSTLCCATMYLVLKHKIHSWNRTSR